MVLPSLGDLHSWMGTLFEKGAKDRSLELLLAITDVQSLISECGLDNAFVEIRLGDFVQHTDCVLVQKLRVPVPPSERTLRLCFFAMDSSNKFSPIPVPIHTLTVPLDGIQWPDTSHTSPVFMEWFALETPPRLDPVIDRKMLQDMLQTAVAFGSNCEVPRVKLALQIKVCEDRALPTPMRAVSFSKERPRTRIDSFPSGGTSLPRVANSFRTSSGSGSVVALRDEQYAKVFGATREGRRNCTAPQGQHRDPHGITEDTQNVSYLVNEAAARLAAYEPSICSSRRSLPANCSTRNSLGWYNPYGIAQEKMGQHRPSTGEQWPYGLPEQYVHNGRTEDGDIPPPPPPPRVPKYSPLYHSYSSDSLPPPAATCAPKYSDCPSYSSDCPPPPPPPPVQSQPEHRRNFLYTFAHGHEYGVAKGDLLDEHVGYLLNVSHPELFRINDVERLRPSRYQINGREVILKWDGDVICHDGPLRQPLREYLAHNDVATDYSFAESVGPSTALSKIPKNQRLSFPRSRPMNRLEAMKMATQQAVLREYAAQETLNTRTDFEALQLSVAEMQKKMAKMHQREDGLEVVS